MTAAARGCGGTCERGESALPFCVFFNPLLSTPLMIPALDPLALPPTPYITLAIIYTFNVLLVRREERRWRSSQDGS